MCLSRAMARSKRVWGFDDSERASWSRQPRTSRSFARSIERAERRAGFGGMWLVQATVRELDEMYSLVEALMAGTRSRKRLDVLEGMRASLCNSIDGF